jgi:hypothetical protein
MDKRVFPIDEKCFIVYTGKSSSDNNSFLRLGNSDKVTKEIQPHFRYIVVPDASALDVAKEKENIQYMISGKICYICNKKNQDILFKALSKESVDTTKLFHQDLSPELDDINRVENKKHFFTIFYSDKNVKLVFNEEVFFDLYEYLNKKSDYESERKRLQKMIKVLDDLYKKNTHFIPPPEFLESDAMPMDLEFSSCVMFLLQENLYIPLSIGMHNIKRKEGGLDFTMEFNTSVRFFVGKDISLLVLEKGARKITITGKIAEGEVIESEVLYGYKADFSAEKNEDAITVLQIYKSILDRVNPK